MWDASKEFTVATYNIFDGRGGQRVVNNILRLIRDGAAIVCLQEVWPMYRGVSMSKLIDQQLPENFRSEYFLGDVAGDYSYGQGILWNANVFSAVRFEKLSLPLKSGLTLSDKLFFLVLGLSPRIFKRSAFIGVFSFGEEKLRITNLHLDFQGGDAHRVEQIKFLTNHLALLPQVEHEIICGDFNTVGLFGKRRKITMLEDFLGKRFASVLSKPYSSAIVQQLDYIFVRNLKISKAKILHLRGSDHYPVTAGVSV